LRTEGGGRHIPKTRGNPASSAAWSSTRRRDAGQDTAPQSRILLLGKGPRRQRKIFSWTAYHATVHRLFNELHNPYDIARPLDIQNPLNPSEHWPWTRSRCMGWARPCLANVRRPLMRVPRWLIRSEMFISLPPLLQVRLWIRSHASGPDCGPQTP
jgi:hypothetical protein